MKLIGSVVVFGFAASLAQAQDACKPGKETNEAKMLAFFAAPIAFSPGGEVSPMRAGQVRLAFDATYVPSPDKDIRSPEVCYRNDKTENTELSPVFPRPRLAVGLGAGFQLEATYLPPLTVMDATPNLFAFALGYARPLGTGGMSLALRGHLTVGSVKGPITCAPDVIQTSNPTGACYATEASDDKYEPNMFGGEGIIGFGANNRLSTYLGAGFTHLRPRFQVGYIDADGNVDDTRIEVNMNRIAAFAGARLRVAKYFSLTAELYSVPEDVTTIRLGASSLIRDR